MAVNKKAALDSYLGVLIEMSPSFLSVPSLSSTFSSLESPLNMDVLELVSLCWSMLNKGNKLGGIELSCTELISLEFSIKKGF